MKRGLEILGIGIIDIDSRDCMMLRAEQTPDKAYLEKQGEEYNLVDWYLDVLRKYKDKLLDITRYVVADAWFSKVKFVVWLLNTLPPLIPLLSFCNRDSFLLSLQQN